MLDSILFEQRRVKINEALERSKIAMMNEEDDKSVRPVIGKIHMVERVKPEDSNGPVRGAHQVPFSLSILAAPGPYAVDLDGDWIDKTAPDAMIPWIITWVRQGIRDRKLPSGFRIEATHDRPGQDEYGRIIPKKK